MEHLQGLKVPESECLGDGRFVYGVFNRLTYFFIGCGPVVVLCIHIDDYWQSRPRGLSDEALLLQFTPELWLSTAVPEIRFARLHHG